MERVFADRFKPFAERHVDKGRVAERHSADRLHAAFDRQRSKTGAVRERVKADRFHAVRDRNRSQVVAVIERVFADAADAGIQDDGSDVAAPRRGVRARGLVVIHLSGAADRERAVAPEHPLEVVAALAAGIVERGARQRFVARCDRDGVPILHHAAEPDIGQRAAALEGVLADRFDVCHHHDALHGTAALERALRDRREQIVDQKLFDIAAEERRFAETRQIVRQNQAARKPGAVKRAVADGGQGFGERGDLERSAAGKRRFADAPERLRQNHDRELRAVFERVGGKGVDPLVRQNGGQEIRAVIEGVRSDVRHALAHGHAFDRRADGGRIPRRLIRILPVVIHRTLAADDQRAVVQQHPKNRAVAAAGAAVLHGRARGDLDPGLRQRKRNEAGVILALVAHAEIIGLSGGQLMRQDHHAVRGLAFTELLQGVVIQRRRHRLAGGGEQGIAAVRFGREAVIDGIARAAHARREGAAGGLLPPHRVKRRVFVFGVCRSGQVFERIAVGRIRPAEAGIALLDGQVGSQLQIQPFKFVLRYRGAHAAVGIIGHGFYRSIIMDSGVL